MAYPTTNLTIAQIQFEFEGHGQATHRPLQQAAGESVDAGPGDAHTESAAGHGNRKRPALHVAMGGKPYREHSGADLGIGDAQAVGLVGLIGIGSLTGRFAIGGLADRLGRGRTLVVMQASLGLSMVLWGAGGGYAALALFALWMGLSYGGIVSLMPALCMDLFGARAVSSIIGALYTGAALGNLGGPWVAGRIFDASGSYAGVIAGCAVLSVMSTGAAWRAVRL